ncbi:hypothetical protein G647_00304 [Cladophialophora carrionii CBS 160.54]|uniref:Histone deacetylation protein Rxt3 n=1 Tax=Cladophialophora carrionii CBS 160.54 TaxID=1279043 RepID=V9DLX9_9EURO|nr:uncharacterized protein G647_00304 [Cladophialophora carrionii CBS 160.54]ETI27855.1 hypothetical protein G647_00304 [Cladophialophora carrionii CBS 160.54]
MLPPSPQHFPPPRFSQPPVQQNSGATVATNGPAAPHKRPGSSMSISSMLGAEPERPLHDPFHIHGQPARPQSGPFSHHGPSMSLGAVMSPPHYSGKTNTTEYSYKPRSKTPDRAAGQSLGVRAQRSSSGSMTQRPGPFYEPTPRSQPTQPNTFHESKYTPPFGPVTGHRDEFEDRARRTSIGGILQRPESQPQPAHMSPSFPTSHPLSRPESIPPSLAPVDRPAQQIMHGQDPPRSNGGTSHYDTRPPGFSTLSRVPPSAPPPMSAPQDRPLTQSLSPELRRPHLNGGEGRLAGILNQQGDPLFGSQNMMRQDSIQSQSDRSVLGDRLRNNRAYSPFAGSVASGPLDDPVRKGSEELSQHRTILGLANESKRGRYSPVPQAVQGAQAQTPAPDAGIKSEHGRVFAGIGSGLGSASAGPTPTPQPLSASPFKRDEGGARLSEENLLKMSRSTSGISKRNRKAMEDNNRAESDAGDAKKGPGRGKRSKYAHSYKLDLDDTAPGQRKNVAFPLSNFGRRAATPTSNPSQSLQNSHSQLPASAAARQLNKSKKTIKISTVVTQAARNRRRHLGIFKYDPVVSQPNSILPHQEKFDVSIRPNLLPSFSDPEQINCTYTVKVSRMWLRERERHLIGREQYLWGSGIYTDDSDPLAAAMHSGFIESARPNDAVLERLIEEQNPKIEGLAAPVKPAAVSEGKDLHITLVVLPQLESYTDSVRYGIKSRSWPEREKEGATPAPHDGVSFMVLKTEFLDDGIMNRRVGRTGKEKRKRLREELADRKRSFEIRDKMVEIQARNREKKWKEQRQQKSAQTTGARASLKPDEEGLKSYAGFSRLVKPSDERENHVPSNNTGDRSSATLEGVGHNPEEWFKQLNDSATPAELAATASA